MARTLLTSREIGNVQRNDLDITTTGEAIIRKVVAGTGISLSSTGVDAGTGDVTINAPTTIGDTVTSGTAGSLLYLGTSGVLAQDNTYLQYNPTSKTLKLRDAAYVTSAGGWNADASSLQIGDSAVNTINSINGTYGIFIDINRGQTVPGASQTSGIRVRANNAKTTGTGYTTAVEAFVTNVGDVTGAGNFQAVEGITQMFNSAAYAEAGGFALLGQATAGASLPEGCAIRVYSGFPTNWTVTDWALFKGMALNSGGAITNLYGLRFSSWSGSNITNSYGIYMDTSIDLGSTLKYAIYSLSTSPSLLSGTLTIPDDAYDATGWNGNLTVPTKNAIRDKIESLTSGSGDVTKVGTPVNNQVGIWTGDGTIEGDVNLTFDTTTDSLTVGNGINIGGRIIGSGSGNYIAWGDTAFGDILGLGTFAAIGFNGSYGVKYRDNSGNIPYTFDTSNMRVSSGRQIGFSSNSTDASTAADVALARVGSAVVKVTDGSSGRGDLEVLDELYDEATWNGSFEVPTKNAVRDKFESLSAGSGITFQDNMRLNSILG